MKFCKLGESVGQLFTITGPQCTTLNKLWGPLQPAWQMLQATPWLYCIQMLTGRHTPTKPVRTLHGQTLPAPEMGPTSDRPLPCSFLYKATCTVLLLIPMYLYWVLLENLVLLLVLPTFQSTCTVLEYIWMYSCPFLQSILHLLYVPVRALEMCHITSVQKWCHIWFMWSCTS